VELLFQPLLGFGKKRLSRVAQSARDGGLVHLVHGTNLVEAQPIQEVQPQETPLLGGQLAHRFLQCRAEVRAEARLKNVKLDVRRRPSNLELRIVRQLVRRTARASSGIECQTQCRGPEPVLERAPAGVFQNPRLPWRRHQDAFQKLLRHLLDEGVGRIHPADG
jgi:hypothetical protein